MNLQTWAEFVQKIEAITNGGRVSLSSDRYGMTIGVGWTQDGKLMGYRHPLSTIEMRSMKSAVQPCVLDQIYNAVQKMAQYTYHDHGEAAAVLAEREACARIAERYEPDEKLAHVTYASMEIRAR